jgi:hypothetical protein
MRRQFITLLTSSFLALVLCLAPAFSPSALAQGAPPDDQGQPGYQGQQPPYPGQGQGPGDQGQEPQGGQQPQGGVGRISVINGNLSTQRGDSGDWVADTVNTPVMPGDTLSTGPNSRVEIELDYANILRLSDNTVAKVADLTPGRIQIQVSQGLVDYVVIRDGDTGNTEVDSPNVAVHPLGRGVYRMRVNSPTESVVTVREGQMQAATPQGSTNVNQGQMITVEGSNDPQYKIDGERARDDWDGWNAERDKFILSASSWQHTDPYYTGSNDLDQYGQWQNAPGYGDVWEPNQSPDWSPYSDGSWAWEPDYGWTWVSAEPWGWAPYHYGRWFMWNNAWAWWPGPVGIGWGGGWYRPIWAPAYVNFFGWGWGGVGFGVGFGWGRLGWLPVGPGDRFFPSWGRGGFNVTNVRNINNITNINNMRGGVAPLAGGRNLVGASNLQAAFNGNSHVLNGINSMAGNRFGEGGARPTRGAVNAGTLRNASFVSGGKLGVAPTKASLSATNRAPAANSIHSAASTHFAGTPAPAANRGSFAQQQASVRQMSRNVTASDVAEQGRGNAEQVNRAPISNARVENGSSFGGGRATTAPAGGQQTSRPFGSSSPRSFGQSETGRPGASSSSPRSAPGTSGQQGWRQFSSQAAPGYRGGASGYGGGASAARPPLQMNRPMFSPRSAPGYGGYSAPRSYSYSSPRPYGGYGGGASAPRSYGAPRTYSAPRPSGNSGGARSSGSGGSHSTAGGGGHSGGGGGGHSGGGGGRH